MKNDKEIVGTLRGFDEYVNMVSRIAPHCLLNMFMLLLGAACMLGNHNHYLTTDLMKFHLFMFDMLIFIHFLRRYWRMLLSMKAPN